MFSELRNNSACTWIRALEIPTKVGYLRKSPECIRQNKNAGTADTLNTVKYDGICN